MIYILLLTRTRTRTPRGRRPHCSGRRTLSEARGAHSNTKLRLPALLRRRAQCTSLSPPRRHPRILTPLAYAPERRLPSKRPPPWTRRSRSPLHPDPRLSGGTRPTSDRRGPRWPAPADACSSPPRAGTCKIGPARLIGQTRLRPICASPSAPSNSPSPRFWHRRRAQAQPGTACASACLPCLRACSFALRLPISRPLSRAPAAIPAADRAGVLSQRWRHETRSSQCRHRDRPRAV